MPHHRMSYALLLSVVLALPAYATEKDCSTEALRRPLVDALVSGGDYETAIARLEQVKQRQDACNPEILDANWYWLRSDLSFSYLKAGREQDCIALLAQLIDNPASPQNIIQQNLEDSGRLQHALETNQRLCTAAHEARLGAYASTPCPYPVSGALASVATAAGGCLALMPGAEAANCPRLEQWQQGKPIRQIRSVKTDIDSPFVDTSRCCSIQALRVAEDDSQYRLRLTGEGRDCYGGSAYDLIDALYLLQDNELIPQRDFSRTR
ncbi:Uncharacterised protein [Ectopseudomonas mendocina]|uniref:Tetratricopeptide repeat protein n=1 Tax=Ectopseudomonas mendocina TaxID=300 RepID=A0A379IS56_ECTME|nr:hypothetical protein [Pseudomonas mendocina]MBL0952703.1 hypothetical protein [Pseudomonas sp.]MDF2074377.1 hypothetical protein [Pseudomonas mendocina]SUD35247.1 Uncharacterised protein [Pseudomonas mendocina]SUD38583.1 Uncharacterised protein [Pseudomonas mendocina]